MTDTLKLTDDEIRDMLDKATDGPWCDPEATTLKVTLSGGTTRMIRGDAHDNTPLAFVSGFDRDEPEEGKANARLIAAAPDLARLALERGSELDAALARAEAAEAERDRLREALQRIADASKVFAKPETPEMSVRYGHETTRRLATAALSTQESGND